MKFEMVRADMDYGIGLVMGAVDKKKLGEYAGSMLVRARKASNQVEVHATDMELFASITMDGAVDEDGDVVLPADKLSAAVKVCGSGNVALASDFDLKTVIDGTTASYEVAGLDPEYFPIGSKGEHDLLYCMAAGKISDCINSVSHAASHDPTKDTLFGINFKLSEAGRLTVAATDGHRLSLAGMDIPGEQIEKKFFEHTFTITNKAAAILSRITASITIGRVAKQCRLYFNSGSVSICSAEGTRAYPEYRRIIPSGPGEVITVDTAVLIEALESCCVMSDDLYRTVHLNISSEVIQVSALGVNNTARAKVPCVCDCEIKLRLNSRYLLQALKSINSDETFIKYFGPTSALMLLPADHKNWDERLEILMPLAGE
jgi:DNA polymerase-3 subunit beta